MLDLNWLRLAVVQQLKYVSLFVDVSSLSLVELRHRTTQEGENLGVLRFEDWEPAFLVDTVICEDAKETVSIV
jgi:hypothetical protein